MTLSNISLKLSESCKANKDIDLAASLPEEFFYDSIDLCIIDAVFSIGVRYNGVKNVIARYKDYIKNHYPSLDKPSRSVSESIYIFENYKNIQAFAKEVLNSQKTSTRNGILKAQAVLEVFKVLEAHNITNTEAFRNISGDKKKSVDKSILSIKGQGSGIMLKYLCMLTGDDDVCKPDRMLHRFVTNISGKKMSDDDLQVILTEACKILKKEYPTLTVRILDNQIWKYQKGLAQKQQI